MRAIGSVRFWVSLVELASSVSVPLSIPLYLFYWFRVLLLYLTTAVWGSRTYAVYNRNKVILAIFVALGLTVVSVSVVRDSFLWVANGRLDWMPDACTVRLLYWAERKGPVSAPLSLCEIRLISHHPIPDPVNRGIELSARSYFPRN